MAWDSHSKHCFILTAAGKPVFSRYGEEGAFSSLASVVQAIVSRATAAATTAMGVPGGGSGGGGQGEHLRSIATTGGFRLVFLVKGPLTLLAVARTGETEHALREQLRSLHGHILFALTDKVVGRLEGNPALDIRPFLQGARPAMLNLVRLSNRMATWLDATPCLPLASTLRGKAAAALAGATAGCPAVALAILVAGYSTVAWAQTRAPEYALRAFDLMLLLNTVQSTASFRTTETSWTPVCLPQLNATGYLHALVCAVGPGTPLPPSTGGPLGGEPGAASRQPPALQREPSRELFTDDDDDDGEEGGGEGAPLRSASLSTGPAAAPVVAVLAGHPPPPHPRRHRTPHPAPLRPRSAQQQPADAAELPAAVFLILVSSQTSPEHVAALSARKDAIVTQLQEAGVLAAVARGMTPPPTPSALVGVPKPLPLGGDLSVSAAGIPGLLHFVFVWKDWRQYTESVLPPQMYSHRHRKALLRAYQHAYDKVLLLDAPQARHYVAAYPGFSEAIGAIAAIHTTHAIVLAAFSGAVATDAVPTSMEKLSKWLKREKGELLVGVPASLA